MYIYLFFKPQVSVKLHIVAIMLIAKDSPHMTFSSINTHQIKTNTDLLLGMPLIQRVQSRNFQRIGIGLEKIQKHSFKNCCNSLNFRCYLSAPCVSAYLSLSLSLNVHLFVADIATALPKYRSGLDEMKSLRLEGPENMIRTSLPITVIQQN